MKLGQGQKIGSMTTIPITRTVHLANWRQRS
jgi:hypothetical protein